MIFAIASARDAEFTWRFGATPASFCASGVVRMSWATSSLLTLSFASMPRAIVYTPAPANTTPNTISRIGNSFFIMTSRGRLSVDLIVSAGGVARTRQEGPEGQDLGPQR